MRLISHIGSVGTAEEIEDFEPGRLEPTQSRPVTFNADTIPATTAPPSARAPPGQTTRCLKEAGRSKFPSKNTQLQIDFQFRK